MRIQHCLFALLTLVSVQPNVRADIIDYSVVKFLRYEQLADNTAPVILDHAEFFLQFSVSNPSDFTSVSLIGGAGLTAVQNGGDWEGVETYTTQAALDAAFPNGTTYQINASGALGTFSEPVTFSGADSYPVTPFFTGTVFSDAQGMDPTQSFTFEWNASPPDGVIFSVWEVNGPQVFEFDGFGGTAETSATLPGGTLSAGTTYNAFLTFPDFTADTVEDFPQGFGLTAFASETFFQFSPATSAVPEPSSGAMLLSIVYLMLLRRRKLSARQITSNRS